MAISTRVRPISTINGCCHEMQYIYRAMRKGEIDLGDGKSFIWVLKQISGLISEGDLEARIEKLEKLATEKQR